MHSNQVIRRQRLEAREKARAAASAREAAMESGMKHSDYEKKLLYDASISSTGKREPLVVPIVLKADTDGSLDALRYSVEGLSGSLCASEEDEAEYEEAIADGSAIVEAPVLLPPGSHLKLSRMGVGHITGQDIDIAATLGCKVYGFNVRANSMVVNKAAETVRANA
jgi:translation initiation factor IF-2